MQSKFIIAIILSVVLSCPLIAAEEEVFIDRDACPGEHSNKGAGGNKITSLHPL